MTEERKESGGKDETLHTSGGKPVIVYILLLGVMALLLMALSFLVHQRSDTEELGKLQTSVSAMQEVQKSEEKIIALQETRQNLEEELKKVQRSLEKEQIALQAEQKKTKALEQLYALQIEYLSERYMACQGIIDEFEANDLLEALPTENIGEISVSPVDRYHQLKAAVAARLLENQPVEN